MSCDQAHFVCTVTPGTLAEPFQLYGFLTQSWCYSHVLKATALPAISHCREKLLEPWDFKLSAFPPEREKNLFMKLFHSKHTVRGKLVSFAGVCFLFNCWQIAKKQDSSSSAFISTTALSFISHKRRKKGFHWRHNQLRDSGAIPPECLTSQIQHGSFYSTFNF